jgi:hypothetical protein
VGGSTRSLEEEEDEWSPLMVEDRSEVGLPPSPISYRQRRQQQQGAATE